MAHALRTVPFSGRHSAPWLALGLAWIVAVGAGVRVLWSYEIAPGRAAEAPIRWPRHSRLPRAHRPTLVVMLHPRCPCSQATLEELDVLLTRLRDRVSAVVLFVVPPHFPGDPETSDLWRRAAGIRNAVIVRDDDGREARRFHVATSGTALLYAATGELLFSGGITASRGHIGDNNGVDTIARFVLEDATSGDDTPVFGCPLRNPSEASRAVL